MTQFIVVLHTHFISVLSLLCTGSFETLWNIWLHNSEHATWQGHRLSVFRPSEHAAEGTASAQEPSLQTKPGDQRRSKVQVRQEKAVHERGGLSIQAINGWALTLSGQSHKEQGALFSTFGSFCVLLFGRELPMLLGCLWSHQGVQRSLAMGFHESCPPLHQPLTLFPNLG